MGKKPARNKPFTFYVTNVVDYEAFIRFLNNAGFEIRTEDWRYTKMGILLTFPMRDHAWQFRDVMSGRHVEGDPVTIVRATTQKMGPDTRESKAVPTEAAILDALRDTYKGSKEEEEEEEEAAKGKAGARDPKGDPPEPQSDNMDTH